jgi:hypothetical protein
MIAGRPRQRALYRLTQFVKHAVLVFAYVTYICITALIVLKTAAPGGYAAQVGMTHPVAVLVMIALISAVATGLFVWLKRELRDGTRHELTDTLAELIRQGRNGYDRGRRRGQPASRAPAENPGRDRPHTGTPVAGRDPTPRRIAGRRPAPGRPPSPGGTNAPPRPSGASAATPTRARTHTIAARAGVVATNAAAPEAAASVVVSQRILQPHDGDGTRPGRSSRPTTQPQRPPEADPTQAGQPPNRLGSRHPTTPGSGRPPLSGVSDHHVEDSQPDHGRRK